MKPCGTCGCENEDVVRFCVACGAPFAHDTAAADARELEHIAWLMQRIPEWRRQGWISPANAGMLWRQYSQRREQILSGTGPPPEPLEGPATTSQSVAAQSSEPGGAPAGGAPSRLARGLAEFAEEHWLKLLGLLAAALIVAGMRQFLGWEWVSRMAQLLIPLVPIGTSAVLLRSGLRSGEYERAGSRATCSVGIVLAAFGVTSANERWLNTAVDPAWCLPMGTLVSTALAVLVRSRTRLTYYEHFLLGGVVVTVLLGMHAAVPLTEATPRGIWLYSMVMAMIGVAWHGLALVPARRSGGSREASAVRLLWSHLCFVLTAAFAFAPLFGGSHAGGLAVAAVAVASLAYVVGAAALGDWRLALAGSGAMLLAGVLMLDALGLMDRPDAWTYLFLVVGLVGLALASMQRALPAPAIGRAEPCDRSVAWCYGMMAAGAFTGAGVALAFQVLAELESGRPLNGPAWPRIAIPAALLTVVYAGAAIVSRMPSVLYAAAITGAFAVALPTDRLLAALGADEAYRLVHDLVPYAVLAYAAAVTVHRWAGRLTAQDRRAWFVPLHVAAAIAVGAGLLVLASGFGPYGPRPGFWWALVSLTAVSLLAAVWGQQNAWPDLAAVSAGEGLIGLAMLASFGAYAAGGTGEGALRQASAALTAYAWLAVMGAAYVEQTGLRRSSATSTAGPRGADAAEPAEPPAVVACWVVPLRLVGSAALAAAMPLAARRGGANAETPDLLIILAGAVAFAGGAILCKAVDVLSLGLSAFALVMGWLTRWNMLSVTPTASALVVAATVLSAASFTLAGWRGSVHAAVAAPLAASAAWYGTTAWLARVPSSWECLAQVPWLAMLYLVGLRLGTSGRIEFGMSARAWAVGLALVYEAAMVMHAVLGRSSVWYAPSSTMALVGLAALARTLWQADRRWAAAAAGHLWGALWVHLELARFSSPAIAALLGVGATAVVVGGWLSGQWARQSESTRSLFASAAVAALITFVYALAVVAEPGAGELSLLAMALAGTVWAALYVLGVGTWYAHAAFAAYFTAYALFLYDRVSLTGGVLDLYLIPVGLYLLILGHLAAARERIEDAKALWWIGLLLVMAPTFGAFYVHFVRMETPLHAVLLVAESVAAVLWGIGNRIRAFVVTGAVFALGFAAVLVVSAIAQVWVGLLALITGLALLSAVYWLSTRSSAAKSAIEKALREWERWR